MEQESRALSAIRRAEGLSLAAAWMRLLDVRRQAHTMKQVATALGVAESTLRTARGRCELDRFIAGLMAGRSRAFSELQFAYWFSIGVGKNRNPKRSHGKFISK